VGKKGRINEADNGDSGASVSPKSQRNNHTSNALFATTITVP
jgi:hypothetical protein